MKLPLSMRLAFVALVSAGETRLVAEEHWSFRPVSHPEIPVARDSRWSRSPIDSFVRVQLEKSGLTPGPEADRTAWLRRVTFDLVGLPPTPEQVAAFLADTRPDAHERVVDGLLESPRYGERWAQHWLDVVRFADTHGFEVNTERPNAWPYRDYVIRSFNADKPYDQFVREQIAGDTMGEDAATGFLVTASALLPGQIGADDVSKRLARQDALDEIVVNTGQTFMALSVGCARCHDHKFDPITARDYYSMQAFFAGVEYGDREMRTPETEALKREVIRLRERVAVVDSELAKFEPIARVASISKGGADGPVSLRPAVHPARNSERLVPVRARRIRFTIRQTTNLEPCLDELEVFDTTGRNIALASAGTRVTSSGDTTVENRHELRLIHDGIYGNSSSWMSSEKGRGWVMLEFSEEREIERVVWGRDRNGEFTDRLATDYTLEVEEASGAWRTVADSSDRREAGKDSGGPMLGGTAEAVRFQSLTGERKTIEALIANRSAAQLVFAAASRKPDDIHLLSRGDPEQPRDPVTAAVPAVLGSLKLERDAGETLRRRTLAEWLTRPEHPLTARVMVNRIWQGHFGVGLVDTSSDFGRSGTRPSHPELLDWLASEFVRSGWSVKAMHRLIVLSATYRQSSRADPEAMKKDGDGRLLWRYPVRRLESEIMRDSMLSVSGRLDLKMGGRGFDLFNNRGGLSGFKPVESYQGDGLRRMIYAHKVRREREAVFGAFDCPDAGQSTSRRRESTTPIQALNLFNSSFTLEQSEGFARRIRSEVGENIPLQVSRAYELAFNRVPDDTERAAAELVVRSNGLPVLCRAVFNSNEFLFVP
jgi:hypothetical protein